MDRLSEPSIATPSQGRPAAEAAEAAEAVMATAAPPVLAMQAARHRWPDRAAAELMLPAIALPAGRSLLLRGPSGSGKSTLLSLAAGVRVGAPGQVRVAGQDWAALPAAHRDAWRGEVIGYIFQQFNLLPWLDLIDNVLLPCRFSARRRAACGASGPRREAERLLDALGLPRDAWRRPAATLSVGQQQRVAAARALIGAPALVLADEPTSALDEPRTAAFMALLQAECRAAGSALLMVSHDSRLVPHFDATLSLDAPAGAEHD
jgi:putative ABC transport system ATP-binding protein